MKKWKCLNSQIILEAPRFKVRQDTLKLPNGEIKEWPYWDSLDSAMILGMTPERKLVMIRQYRYLVGDEVIEFPAGGLEENENVSEAAKREFEEETGYKADSFIKLASVYETYSQLNRQIHIFFTKNIRKSRQNPDRGKRGYEDIKVELIDLEDAVQLALENKIAAMGCSLAILLLNEKIKRGEIKI